MEPTEGKLRKDQVRYVPNAFVGEIVCWLCKHIREGFTCAKVNGTVSRTGTCDEAEHLLNPKRVQVRTKIAQ